MKIHVRSLIFSLSIMLLASNLSLAQDNLALIKSHLKSNLESLSMLSTDIEELVVTDVVKMNGLDAYQVWVQQEVNGIPVYGAINSYTIYDQSVRSVGNAFALRIDKGALLQDASIVASKSVGLAAKSVSVDISKGYRMIEESTGSKKIKFESPDMLDDHLMVYKEYYKNAEGGLDLMWRVELYPKVGHDMWSILVQADNGEIIKKNNYVVKCQFEHGKAFLGTQDGACEHNEQKYKTQGGNTNTSSSQTGSYKVVPFPFESLNFTDLALVSDPSDSVASPFGWHDVNGAEGAEFTTLAGNNARTIIDRDDDGVADINGENPDGGDELIFDFPFDPSLEPVGNTDAAMVNAFYVNNVMHDFAYHYGFDESINFQETNYTGQNNGSDGVVVRVQAGLNTGNPDAVNNANFFTPDDGQNPVMSIYVGDNGAGTSFRINSPSEIAGGLNIGLFDFAPPVNSWLVTGNVVRYLDGSFNSTFGCEEAINPDEVMGNVALIDRGECFFELKVANAQAAGAVAVIICNFLPNASGGLGVADIENPNIPAAMLSSTDCARIVALIDEGVEVSFENIASDAPSQIDLVFDNGIIAHEYGHGLSTRSIGGPSNSNCLLNEEQQGEGWSDFFSLVTTTAPGLDGTEARSLGTYGSGQSPTGSGIRRFPYSTNPAINNQNMEDIVGNINIDGEISPHPIGEIWTGALWNMYWGFVDQYGFDADFIKGTGGNNMAIQLVFDAMKITPCGPGFIDARDAVIMADEVRYEGANGCIIWDAFARKGIGFSAEQGDPNNNNDGLLAFDLPPSCVKELVVQKNVPENARADEAYVISGLVINQKDEVVTNVVYTDELQEGGVLMDGPSNYSFSETSGLLSVDIGTLNPGDSAMISYVVLPNPEKGTKTTYFDDMEDEDVTDEDWDTEILEGTEAFIREEFDQDAFSGDFFWVAITTAAESDYGLRNFVDHELTMDFPVLRFYHFYDTKHAFDGGFIEIKEADTESWRPIIQEDILRNSYNGKINFQTFVLPNLRAFWGDSDGYIDSYVDLRAWRGKTVNFRWRYGYNEFPGVGGEWRIDDVSILDLVNSNGQACVTSAEGDNACVTASAIGTVIEGGEVVSVIDLGGESLKIEMYPNPASDYISLSFDSQNRRDALLSIYSIDGKMINQQQLNINAGLNTERIGLKNLASGMYLAKIRVENKEVTEKFVIE